MKRIWATVFACLIVAPLMAQEYDVVILNGRVMDPETFFDAVRTVGIRDGRIVTITKASISGADTIDATGHVVAPGFIDSHHHCAGNLWGVKASLRDGVTTPLDLELGAINIDAWYAQREGKWPANFGAAVSHEFHRMRVLDNMPIAEPADGKDFAKLRKASYQENDKPDWAVTVATLEQLNEMLANMDDPKQIGPAMAIALLTTLYGAVIANAFALPIAAKLALRYEEEKTNRGLILETISGIQEGMNPRVLEELLKAYLPENQRNAEEVEENG